MIQNNNKFGTITRFVNGVDPHAQPGVDQRIYAELRSIAAAHLRRERNRDPLLDTATLVHEAWVRLSAREGQRWDSRAHFFASAANAMRCILVDQARRRVRRGQAAVLLDSHAGAAHGIDATRAIDLLCLDEALDHLGRADPRAATIVSLRFFAGLAMPQIAETLGLSLRTTERDWTYARAWLLERMESDRNSKDSAR
jgi:RNA polymerase sigma factor (TIGR02999 family)